jgi:hypothetical protein
MRTVNIGATRVAWRRRSGGSKRLDNLAAQLIRAGYIRDDHYLEMKYLDPKWMVAIRIYALTIYRSLGGAPSPVTMLDRD